MSARPLRSQPMPPEITSRLRAAFEALPPAAARFRCENGRQFLLMIRRACEQYGARQVGDAIGMSISSVYKMCHRELPRRIYAYPTEQQMTPVRRAWSDVESRWAVGRQVRRGSPMFVAVQEALAALRAEITTDEIMIAVALGTEPSRLRIFDENPLRRPRRRP